MTADVWIRFVDVGAIVDQDEPIVMPRGFRRPRVEVRALFDGFSAQALGGDAIVIVGSIAGAAAIAGIAAGVVPPARGTIQSSHRVAAVLRRRARPLVDQRVHHALDRELRLRGIRVRGDAVVEEAAALADVSLASWTSGLTREEYSRLAPAAIVCSGAPIVVLDGVFTHRESEFEERLAVRMSGRQAGGLATVVTVSTDRALGAALGACTLAEVCSLPETRARVGGNAAAITLDDDDDDADVLDDDDDADDHRTYSIDPHVLERTESIEEAGLSLAVRDVRVLQPESTSRYVTGTMPFCIEIDVAATVSDARWRVLLVEHLSGAVVCRVDAPAAPSGGSGELVLELPAGLPIGRHWILVQGCAEDDAGRHVFGAEPLGSVTCKRTVDKPPKRLAAEASWRT